MMRRNEFSNGRLQLRHTAMNTSTQLFVGELGEPALHEVQPRPIRRREVDVKARALREPMSNHRGLMRPVVVHDQMGVEVPRHGSIDRVKELPELGRTMPLMKLRDEFTGLHVERGKQRGGAMPSVVVRATLDLAGAHRQHRLRAIQGLNLRLLIDTKHHGMRRWLHVQPNDVSHLVDQQWVRRKLECLRAMRLQAKGAPDLLNRGGGGCVWPRGVSSSVRTITCSIRSSLIWRGVPGRGSSYNPSRRSRTNRPRHLQTVT